MAEQVTVAEALVKLEAETGQAREDLAKYKSSLSDTEQAAQKSKSSHESFFGGILGGAAKIGLMATGVGAVVPLIGELGGKLFDASKAADEEQVGMNRLYTTMGNSIKGWSGNTDAVEAYIAKQQNLAFSDDSLRDSLNFLVGQTHDLKQAQDLQSTAMDLARAKGIDLETATKAVGKVDQDSIGILKKLGIEVTDHMTKEQALAAIRSQTAGQAEAYANTTQGAMERLQTHMGNVVESIGHTILPKITAALGGVADFVGSDAFQGALNTGINMIAQAFDMLGQAIQVVSRFLSPLIPPVQQFIASISAGKDPLQSFGTLLGQIGPIIQDLAGKVLQMVGDALPGILSKLGEWGAAFVNWVGPQIPPLLSKLLELLGQLGGWLTGTALPTLIQKLGEWGGAFIAWVGPQIPPLLAKLGELLGQLGGWLLNTGLPTVIQKLSEWGGAFVAWVGPQIPPLLEKLGQLLGQVGGWLLNTGLPTVISKLAEWGGALIGWVGPKILPLLGELGKLLLQLGGWLLTTALPAIVGKLVEWGGAFLGFVGKDVLPFIAGKLGELLSAITGWIGGAAGTLISKAGEMGGNIITGIVNGLRNAGDQVKNFILNLASGALDAIKGFFGIHSPSSEMTDVGERVGEGLAVGIDNSKAQTLAKMQETFDALTHIVEQAMNKDVEHSLVWWFDKGLDQMFQHANSAWIPQTELAFHDFFVKMTTWFENYTAAWVNSWKAAMDSMQTPTAPASPPGTPPTQPPAQPPVQPPSPPGGGHRGGETPGSIGGGGYLTQYGDVLVFNGDIYDLPPNIIRPLLVAIASRQAGKTPGSIT